MVRLHSIAAQLSRAGLDDPTVSFSLAKSLSILDEVRPKVDGSSMSAAAVINTDVVDYQREVILASGVDTENHEKNPQVLFEHGEGVTFDHPLALSEDPQGNYTVTRQGDFEMHGVSYFEPIAKHFPIVYQYFGLIDMGAIRATSIHVQPRVGGKAIYTDSQGNKYTVTEASDLIEWSWCKLGVNPEALKKSFRSGYRPDEKIVRAVELQADFASQVLRKGTIGGERLLEPVRKSLLAMTWTGNSQTFVSGDSEQEMKKSLTRTELRKLSKKSLSELLDSSDQYTAYTVRQAKSMIKAMEDQVEEDHGQVGPPEDGAEHHSENTESSESTEAAESTEGSEEETEQKSVGENGQQKMGSKVMTEAYEALTYLLDQIESKMEPVEHPDVKGGMGEIITQARALQAAMDGLHAKAYGNGFTSKEEEEEQVAAEEEQLKVQLKSFLSKRKNQTAAFQILGYEGQLRRLSQSRGVPHPIRKSLGAMAAGLGALQAAASSDSSGMVSHAEYDAVIAERDEVIAHAEKLQTENDRLCGLLEEVLPAS